MAVVEWLNLTEAVKTLGSESTVYRHVRARQLRSKLDKVDGRKSQRLFYAPDVERLKQHQPANGLVRTTAPQLPASRLDLADKTTELLREFVTAPKPVPVTEKFWLSIKEAAELSGLPKKTLRELCEERPYEIGARKFGRSWRIRRITLMEWEG